MKAMRLSTLMTGPVMCSTAVSRLKATSSESRTIASASSPSDRSRCRSQIAAVATPSAKNARASMFCRAVTRSLIGSGDPEGGDVGHLADQRVHDLWVPLLAGAVEERRDRLFDRARLAVGAIGDQRVVR